MEPLRETILFWISMPIYVLVIGAEMLFSHFGHRHLYSTKGFFSNLYLTSLNFGLDALMKFVGVWMFMNYFCDLGGFQIKAEWNPVIYWVVLTVAEDFMYYWEHRVDHYCRVFWAVHVTHHSSEEYNMSVGFRSSVFQPLYRFMYFVPLAYFGFTAEDIMFTYAWTQIWGVLVHTQTVGKLWWPIEYIFTSPSHHRIHHASNTKYLDRNMGMFLIIWDRMFGTFEKERDDYEPIRYGLTKNIGTYHPVKIIFHEWRNIFADMKKSTKLKHKLMYLFAPPGWSHDGSTKTSNQLRKEEEEVIR